MMKKQGVLIYTPEDAARNRWFIEQLCQYAEPEGLSLRLVLSDEADIRQTFTPEDAFVINRSRIYKYSSYADGILHLPCFNSPAVTGITNEKYTTYAIMHGEHGIPMAKTQQVHRNEPLPETDYPVVAKPADGHGGTGVAWIENEAELMQYAENFRRLHPEPTCPFLIQEPVVTGWDVRVYVLGGEIYAAVLRTSDRDFRSNFSLGGHAEPFKPDKEMRRLVMQVQKVLPLDFAGVDILRHPDGGYLLGEIEDAVGCRMLYALTDRNPAKDYIRYISEKLHKSE